MKITLISIFCMVMLSGCISTRVKYELRESAELKVDASGKSPSVSTGIIFSESW